MTLLRENITILDSNKNKDALESNYNFERKRAQKYFSFNVATISVNEVQLHKYNINHFPAVAILFKRKYVNKMWLNVQHNLDMDRAIVRRFNEIQDFLSFNAIYSAEQREEFGLLLRL